MDTINKQTTKSAKLQKAWNMKSLYLLIAIPLAFIAVFNYAPMYGVIVAFKDFRYADGILGSDWNNFEHFYDLFHDVLFLRAFWNTIKISLCRIFICFPIPIIFALLLNELKSTKFKRTVQTISYLPHFMSWVIIAGFVYQMLSPEIGAVNSLLGAFGLEPIYFMSKKGMFLPILVIALLWQSIGWSSIIYLASMSSVDPELYESADLDGANRFQKAISITLPSIAPMVTIQFILSMSSIMKGGFDPVYNLSNGMILEVADTIETFSFRAGILGARYDYAAAIGLFQNVIGLMMVLITNQIAKSVNEYGIW